MRFWRKNDGFTLMELLIVITVGSLVSFAATSILLFAMRFYRINLDTVEHQSILRIMLAVVDNMSSEGEYRFDVDTDQIEKDSNAIIKFNSSTKQVVTGTGSVLMEDVDGFDIKKPTILELYDDAAKNLYTFSVQMDGQTFNSTVYSRTKAVQIEDRDFMYSVFPYLREKNWEADDPDVDYEAGRDYLVNIAASQIGSDGRIMDYPRADEGTFYSLWYLDRLQFPEGWSEETPWCSIFASWVVDQVAQEGTRYDEEDDQINYLNSVPREADVNFLWLRSYIQTGMYNLKVNNHTSEIPVIQIPKPGDLIFFEFKNEELEALEYHSALEDLSTYEKDVLREAIDWEKEGWYININEGNDPDVPVATVISRETYEEWLESYPSAMNAYVPFDLLYHLLHCTGDGLDHVGIVAKVEDEIVYTIEGNSETLRLGLNETTVVNQVVLRQYALNDEDIFGYATLNWNEAYK